MPVLGVMKVLLCPPLLFAAAFVLHSAVVGGSVVGVVGPLWVFGEFHTCELDVFRFF